MKLLKEENQSVKIFSQLQMTEKGELITVDGITLGGKTLSAFGSYILGTQVEQLKQPKNAMQAVMMFLNCLFFQ